MQYMLCKNNTMYKNGDVSPSSVVVQPDTGIEPTCEPYRASNEISCSYLTVFCLYANDLITLRIVGAGHIFYEVVRCGDITEEAFNFE